MIASFIVRGALWNELEEGRPRDRNSQDSLLEIKKPGLHGIAAICSSLLFHGNWSTRNLNLRDERDAAAPATGRRRAFDMETRFVSQLVIDCI